ncbi:MAG: hypothetical protein WKF87_20280 [Chryseolinea sp.]
MKLSLDQRPNLNAPFSLFYVVIFFIGCSDSDTAPGAPPVASFTTSDLLTSIHVTSTSVDPDSPLLKYRWSCSDASFRIDGSGSENAAIIIPEGHSESDVLVTLTVNDGTSASDATQSVTIPEYTHVRAYGLGTELDAEGSNNASYSWYMDQGVSGKHSAINCGPTVVTMAIKWFNENFNLTPEDARKAYRPAGGWWFTDDVIAYLEDNGATNFTIRLDDINDVKTEIDAGNIILLCLDMYYVSAEERSDYHAHKFYSTPEVGWGHFLLIKGYKEVAGKVFYETYDPYSLGKKYPDGSLKGMDRYYAAEDLDVSTGRWWDFAIIVTKSDVSAGRLPLNVSDIVHKPGR